jgi:hypothetical protein
LGKSESSVHAISSPPLIQINWPQMAETAPVPLCHNQIAGSTRRATERRWRACCRVSSVARRGIVVVCSCRGKYSRQQCSSRVTVAQPTLPSEPLRLPSNRIDVTAERVGTVTVIVGGRVTLRSTVAIDGLAHPCRPRRAARPPFSRSPDFAMIEIAINVAKLRSLWRRDD